MGEIAGAQQIAVDPLDVVVECDMRLIAYQRADVIPARQQRAQNCAPTNPEAPVKKTRSGAKGGADRFRIDPVVLITAVGS